MDGWLLTFGDNNEDEMREVEYTTEKHAMVHIVLSLLIMGGVAYYYIESGYYRVGRLIMVCFVPAMCIWIPDTVAGLKHDLVSARTIRIGGWVLLLVIVFCPFILRRIFW